MTNRPRPTLLLAAITMLAALAASIVLGQDRTQTEERPPGQDPPRDEKIAFEASLDFAQVEKVVVTVADDGTYRFSVTVRHRDEGWDHYADVWEVYDPESGEVLGTRELAHPHDTEQPFTRSLSSVRIPGGVRLVAVRAACNVHGFGGREVALDLDTEEGDGYEVRR
ncbi:MAG: hypothetical protein U5J97_10960 [Trueperaceae bacterium]|nr:hypothetical protein [Trueperaceae bacterium]